MKYLVFYCSILCLAFSAQGCAGSANFGHGDSRVYELKLSVKDDNLTVVLSNKSKHALLSYGWFRAAGIGSAGLYLSFLDEGGRKHHMCTQIDQAPGRGHLLSHSSMKTEIAINELKNEYCLSAGTYTVRATYAVPRSAAAPEIVAESRTVLVTVK